MIRILHTSDWHLGKRLGTYDRSEEHVLFFEWLLEILDSEMIDVLIVAGDIFDSSNPSSVSLKLYYDFLWKAHQTHCTEIVITGGNHDSAATLNAPRDLLKLFHIHVVGSVTGNPEDEIISITKAEEKIAICAVPFLRDKDIRTSIAGETIEERENTLIEGIVGHYESLIPFIHSYKKENIPVIATGHLFTAGSIGSESERNTFVGTLGQIPGSRFPTEFDYIALGHLHRPQTVAGLSHIRYSGSPFALSFSEADHRKEIVIADFVKREAPQIKNVPIPLFRKLLNVKGDIISIKDKLHAIPQEAGLKTWLNIEVETKDSIFNLDEQINQIIENNPSLEIVFLKQLKINEETLQQEKKTLATSLHELDPVVVFEEKCKKEYPSDYGDLMETFRQAMDLMAGDL